MFKFIKLCFFTCLKHLMELNTLARQERHRRGCQKERMNRRRNLASLEKEKGARNGGEEKVRGKPPNWSLYFPNNTDI